MEEVRATVLEICFLIGSVVGVSSDSTSSTAASLHWLKDRVLDRVTADFLDDMADSGALMSITSNSSLPVRCLDTRAWHVRKQGGGERLQQTSRRRT